VWVDKQGLEAETKGERDSGASSLVTSSFNKDKWSVRVASFSDRLASCSNRVPRDLLLSPLLPVPDVTAHRLRQTGAGLLDAFDVEWLAGALCGAAQLGGGHCAVVGTESTQEETELALNFTPWWLQRELLGDIALNGGQVDGLFLLGAKVKGGWEGMRAGRGEREMEAGILSVLTPFAVIARAQANHGEWRRSSDGEGTVMKPRRPKAKARGSQPPRPTPLCGVFIPFPPFSANLR